jgi:hypothetical protein
VELQRMELELERALQVETENTDLQGHEGRWRARRAGSSFLAPVDGGRRGWRHKMWFWNPQIKTKI